MVAEEGGQEVERRSRQAGFTQSFVTGLKTCILLSKAIELTGTLRQKNGMNIFVFLIFTLNAV